MIDNEGAVMEKKKKGLGRGLSALFEDDESVYPQPDSQGQTPGAQRRMAGVDQLEPGPWQPRQDMDDEALNELSESIKTHGVLQPILVRAKSGHDDRFQIIAGERRWRAAQKARLHEVPVIVKEMSDVTALEIALIENLQRADLNALEEALGYKRLMDEFGHTQEKLAAGLGKSRSHVANMVRLLTLPPGVQTMIRQGKLSAGHARALVAAKDPEELAKVVVAKGLSVRETERRVSAESGKPTRSKDAKKREGESAGKDVNTLALERAISDALGMKVTIDHKGHSEDGHCGIVIVEYKTFEQLNEVLLRLHETPVKPYPHGTES